MNDTLRAMARTTFNELRYRKALPEKSTSAMRRYAADYLVGKSPFSAYFKALGITKGCQLKHSFDWTRSYSYLFTIYRLYCIHWAYKFDPALAPWIQGDDVLQRLTISQQELCEYMKEVKDEYKKVLYNMTHARYVSMGRSVEYKECKYEDAKIIKQYSEKKPTELIKGLPLVPKEAAPAAAIILLSNNLTNKPKAKKWLEERTYDIQSMFVKNAAWRYYLALSHNVQLINHDDDIATAYHLNDGWTESIAGGLSHKELNDRAWKYQQHLLFAKNAMIEVQPLPDETLESIIKKEEPVIQESHDEWKRNIPKRMSKELFTAGTVTASDIPQEVKALAERLASKHGPVTITTESSGMHLYIADPELLQKDGTKEFSSRHLAINVDKYFGIGQWNVDLYPTRENVDLYNKYRKHNKEVPCAMSMKTNKLYSVENLLIMVPVEQRMQLDRPVNKTVMAGVQDKNLVYDEQGNLVPEPPGHLIPLTELPKLHPALSYLEKRGFDIDLLHMVYNISYCDGNLPEDRATGRYWSKLPEGTLNCPRGRIIIPILNAKGVNCGWQARAIDYIDRVGNKYWWSNKESWVLVQKGSEIMGVSDKFPSGFKGIRKYLNVRGLARNEALFGIRQAVQCMAKRPYEKRVCFLVEGAMDAMKGGPPCVALLGKNMSEHQASTIKSNFTRVVVIADKDAAGREMVKSVSKRLPDMPIQEAYLPEGKKDLGDCTYEEAREIIDQYL